MLLDQFELPRSHPLLQLFLSANRLKDVVVDFIPHEVVNLIPLGESLVQIILVLMNPAVNVVCHADVECAISLARQDVHKVILGGTHGRFFIGVGL